MTEISNTYMYDLVLPKKDQLWSAIVSEELQRRQQRQMSALSRAVLKDIQVYNKQHKVDSSKTKSTLSFVLETEKHSNQQLPSTTTSVQSTSTSTALTTPTVTSPYSSWMCAICMDDLAEKNPASIPCPTCQFCTSCLSQYVKVQIEDKSVNMTSTWSMRCPCLLSGCELSTDDVERIVHINDDLDDENKRNLLSKFRKFALDLEIQNDSSRGE
jgi:hypothetical protein